jgi:hypothetical protein
MYGIFSKANCQLTQGSEKAVSLLSRIQRAEGLGPVTQQQNPVKAAHPNVFQNI